MKKILKIIWNEFIFGGHLQCLGVVGVVYVSSVFLQLEIGWKLLVIPYLIFYPIYANDRIEGIITDETENEDRTRHIKKYLKIASRAIFVDIFLLLILLLWVGNFTLFIFSSLLLIFGLFYPLYFKGITKKIYLFKNLYVASFFALVTFIPLIYHHYDLKITTLLLVSYIFFRTLLMQCYLDCKDVKTDKSIGLKTFPILIGKEKALSFLNILNIVFTPLFLVMISIFYNTLFLFFLFTVPIIYYGHFSIKKGGYKGYILISSEFFFWLILMLIISNLLV